MKKIILLLCIVASLSGWTYTFDYDAPQGSDNANTLDTAIQNTKKHIGERMNYDHWFVGDNTSINDLTSGGHRKVTAYNLGADPTQVTNAGIVYTKEIDSDIELFYIDDDGTVTQVTSDGELTNPAEMTVTNLTVSSNVVVSDDVIVTDDGIFGGDVSASNYIHDGCAVNISPSGLVTTNSDMTIKAWAVVAANGTIEDHYNISSISQTGTGAYTISFDTDFASTHYAVTALAHTAGEFASLSDSVTKAIGSCGIQITGHAGGSTDSDFMVIATGDQ